jgi:predicted transcriptional regulator
MKYFLNEIERWIDTDTLLKVLNLDISTIQRSVKNCMKKRFYKGFSRTWTEETISSDIKSFKS